MAKMVALLLAIVCMTMASFGRALPDDQSPESVEKWFKHFPNAKPQNMKLRLYLNNILTMVPPASVAVAKANTTDSTPDTNFGLVRVIDGPITEQPMTEHPDAKVIARVQGLGVFSSQTEVGILEAINFVFTDGEFKGSTLTTFGRLAPAQGWNDISIVGGSGDFRMAQGTIASRIYFIDPTIGDVQEMVFDFYYYPPSISMEPKDELRK
ncbi:OLC1v1013795C1 [Oldenlandia corymbosa var. corymbosa]|uniref:Dirigent protein n=1 Tax=Oldenlandia corymbosa var. corymbosa TaxID=529605 RepID=A0AAV1DZD0_OLDCO|nr:OLC1v1013795C1 [Oldenlandia corymbosa var. corymbosa]